MLDKDGNKVRPLENESGYWRIDSNCRIEIVMARDEGVIELWYGELADKRPQIDLVTDAVARTATASDYTGGKRLYGLVKGDLMWVYEKAGDRTMSASQVLSAELLRPMRPQSVSTQRPAAKIAAMTMAPRMPIDRRVATR